MQVVELESFRGFDPAKMRTAALETPRLLCDPYCLELGQSQPPHAHAGSDNVYVVLEGEGTFRAGTEETAVEAGSAVLAPGGAVHGVTNEGPDQLVCLVFMAPHPKPHRP